MNTLLSNQRARTFVLACAALAAAWSNLSSSRAATPDAVVAWGKNDEGETTVPLAAQSGVTAIAAGAGHTVALRGSALRLRAERQGDELGLAWPPDATGFTLQSTRSLAPPVVWTDYPAVPATDEAQSAVTTKDISGTERYFRLRSP